MSFVKFTSYFQKHHLISIINHSPTKYQKNISIQLKDYYTFGDSIAILGEINKQIWHNSIFKEKQSSTNKINYIDNSNFENDAENWKFKTNTSVDIYKYKENRSISIKSKEKWASAITEVWLDSLKDYTLSIKAKFSKESNRFRIILWEPEYKPTITDTVINTNKWLNLQIPIHSRVTGYARINFQVFENSEFQFYEPKLTVHCQEKDSMFIKNWNYYKTISKKKNSNYKTDYNNDKLDRNSMALLSGTANIFYLPYKLDTFVYIKPESVWTTYGVEMDLDSGWYYYSGLINILKLNKKLNIIVKEKQTKKAIHIYNFQKNSDNYKKWHYLIDSFFVAEPTKAVFKITSGIGKSNISEYVLGDITFKRNNLYNSIEYPNLEKERIYSIVDSLYISAENIVDISNFDKEEWFSNAGEYYLYKDKVTGENSIIITSDKKTGGIFSFYRVEKDLWYTVSSDVRVLKFSEGAGVFTEYGQFRIPKQWNTTSKWQHIQFSFRTDSTGNSIFKLKSGKDGIVQFANLTLNRGRVAIPFKNKQLIDKHSLSKDSLTKITELALKGIQLDNFYANNHKPQWVKKLSRDDLIGNRFDRWIYALNIYSGDYNLFKKIFGGGFSYLKKYGAMFNRNPLTRDYPHNPIISEFLAGGFVGGIIYILFLVSTLIAYFKKRKELPLYFMWFVITFFFSFFSGNIHFTIPVFAFLSTIPFLDRNYTTHKLD